MGLEAMADARLFVAGQSSTGVPNLLLYRHFGVNFW